MLIVAAACGVFLIPETEAPRPQADADPAVERPRTRPSEREPAIVLTAGREYQIALDEAVLKHADGSQETLRLDPPATSASLPTRLREFASRGEALPVCYLPGKPRTPENRRVITRDITVELPSPDAAPSLPAGLTLKERPAYAPGFAVVSAADPFAALAALEPLRKQPGIVSADVQLAVRHWHRAMPDDPLIGDQWHLKNAGATRTHVNVENAWRYGETGGVKGSGVRIGIVDDGLQTAHPDLSANVDTTNDYDWLGNDNNPNPGSGDDHGTSCAGNAGARGNNATGVSGTAPEATLVGLRLISTVEVTDSQEAAALAHLPQLIQIKSNSWGPSDDGNQLGAPGPLTRAALANAAATGRGGLGSIFLWAGGNGGDVLDNSNYDGYANDIHTIAVAACDNSGGQSWYSEPGANLVVAAPSNGGSLGITTTDRTGTSGYASGDYTDDFGGTSSATPTAAGIVALMLEKNPGLGWRDVQEILIRSAFKIRPTDSDWSDNPAGFHFNHKFGAGLIDATAAVDLAATWTNLAAATSQTVSQTALNVSIPDNNATGITRSFTFSGTNLRTEHVTVTLSSSHVNLGDLEVTLVSPSGMISRLAERHDHFGESYDGWTFSSVRHWGENSGGTWTLRVADRRSGTTGALTAASVTIHGPTAIPANPGPVVAITTPAAAAVFSPGASVAVQVAASDLNADGSPGTVASVQLLDNGAPIATDFVAPFEFAFTPANGSHSLTAIATDGEGETTTSGAVVISVVDQPPVVTAAVLTPAPQPFADEVVSITGLAASDPEGQSLTFAYAWEKSADAVNWSAAAVTTASLPPAPGNAGFLWRCRITASDGTNTSAAFTTAAVNCLVRPPASAPLGVSFSYDSGLVLRGTDTPLSRDALINEFSQGVSGTSEWVEILVLREASFRNWKLADSGGNQLAFADAAVWDSIPAGTLIVIYNGASKDSLLPVDDADFADGKVVLASNSAGHFTGGWPGYGNGGDSVILRDPGGSVVAGFSYGTSNAASPNVGSAGAGSAVYYSGSSDAGADSGSSWAVTTSQVARHFNRAAGDLFLSEYVEGSSNNKALEIYNPSGVAVDLSAQNYSIHLSFNGGSTTTTIPLTGTVPAGGVFVIKHSLASADIVANQTAELAFNGDDAILLRKNGVTVDSFGVLGTDPGTAWTSGGVTTVDKTLRRKSTIATGDTNSGDAFDPSLEWDQFNQNDFTGLGSHTAGSGGLSISLSIAPASFAENAGPAAATGTVTLSAPPASDVVVALLSSDPTAASVPATVTVLAGQTVANFGVAAIDDAEADGPQLATVSATAVGYAAENFVVTVTDDEPSLDGVTPGAANTPANAGFIADLRSGVLNAPALFRFGATSQTPAGLIIDPATGLVSGIPNGAAGSYLIVIERHNTLGETVSQSFSLSLSGSSGYSSWIAGFLGLSSIERDDDPDFDGMDNLLEYHLGAHPGTSDAAVHLPVFAKSGTTLTLTWWRLKAATDTAGTAEWSDTLGSWDTVGIATQVIGDSPTREQVRATLVVGPGEPEKFLRLKVE